MATSGLQQDKFVYLQVKGKNQLQKEIGETWDIKDKKIDTQALHRNEITLELEGEDIPSKQPK